MKLPTAKPMLITIVSLIFAYYSAVFLHEYAHGTMAWLFGFKSNPFAIQYGHWIYPLHVDEAVPYDRIMSLGAGYKAALIGISGYTASAMLFLLGVCLIAKRVVKHSPFWMSYFYWLAVVSMTAIFGYTPMGTFGTSQGDIGRFVYGLNISAWWPFVIGGLFSIMGILYLLLSVQKKVIASLPIRSTFGIRAHLILTLYFLFLYFPLMSLPESVMSYKTWIFAAIFIVMLLLYFRRSCEAKQYVR